MVARDNHHKRKTQTMTQRMAMVVGYDTDNMDPQIMEGEIMLTKGDDIVLEKEVRAAIGDDFDHDWDCTGIAHTPNAAIIEWESAFGTRGFTTIIWGD